MLLWVQLCLLQVNGNEIKKLITLDFDLLFKYGFECLFVKSECSLQSSEVCFEVRSDPTMYDDQAF